jgi:hypothetical protein
MFLYSDQRQPLYGVIGILIILFGSAIAVWLYLAS